MPFAYFGAKHGLARHYPAPAYPHIIEPFAGAAGYSIFWATPEHKVTLVDSDPLVIEMWHQLQSTEVRQILNEAEAQLLGDQITSPFIYSIGCGLYRVKPGGTAKKSTMMEQAWPGIRRRIEAAVPMIRTWEIICADYRSVVNRDATWFIDPPYTGTQGTAGQRYGHKSHTIDYTYLGQWAANRDGQIIVCEQDPADWLNFSPLKQHRTRFRVDDEQIRTELVWTTGTVATDQEAQLRAARTRRWNRMKPRTDKWSPLSSR